MNFFYIYFSKHMNSFVTVIVYNFQKKFIIFGYNMKHLFLGNQIQASLKYDIFKCKHWSI